MQHLAQRLPAGLNGHAAARLNQLAAVLKPDVGLALNLVEHGGHGFAAGLQRNRLAKGRLRRRGMGNGYTAEQRQAQRLQQRRPLQVADGMGK